MGRRIVGKLLTGLSEKEIAASLNQSVSTTHKHITTIYARFGVNGRAALMALWLGA
jgi:DNA-binding CsgD family transcriptional regulator